MAGIKISNLPAAPSALLTDVYPVDQLPGPVTYKQSNSQLLTLFQSNGTPLTKTDDTNVTLTLGGSPAAALLNAASLTLGWSGQLAISRGGTGVAAVPTTASASNFAAWDTNVNLPANNFLQALASTATAAGTTTLTVSSAQTQLFTGTTTQTVKLAVTSTLTLGQSFVIINKSTASVTVQSSGGNTINSVLAGTSATFFCVSLSGTTAASWYSTYLTTAVNPISFTPTFTFATPGDLSVAYSIQTGLYWIIGNLVFISYTIRFTPTHTSASGNALFGGLPFTPNASANFRIQSTISEVVTWPAGMTQMLGNFSGSNLIISGIGSGAASTNFSIASFPTATQRTVVFSGFYAI